jgi:hypothetical protein
MKMTRRRINLLSGTIAIVAGLVLYGVWANQQAAIAKSRLGRYQGTYHRRGQFSREGKPVKVVSAFDLMPDGQWILHRHHEEVYLGPKKSIPPWAKINPDGTIYTVQKGTYKIVGNEVDLIQHRPRMTPPISVNTARFTENGFALIRSSTAHKMEDIRSGEVPEGKEPRVSEVSEDKYLHYVKIK